MREKTYAEVLIAKGRREGRRQAAVRERRRILFRLLQGRFGEVPMEMQAVIKKTRDVEQLDRWFDQAIAARSLVNVGIG